MCVALGAALASALFLLFRCRLPRLSPSASKVLALLRLTLCVTRGSDAVTEAHMTANEQSSQARLTRVAPDSTRAVALALVLALEVALAVAACGGGPEGDRVGGGGGGGPAAWRSRLSSIVCGVSAVRAQHQHPRVLHQQPRAIILSQSLSVSLSFFRYRCRPSLSVKQSLSAIVLGC